MTINQAFTILSQAGGIRAARIITENNTKLSRIRVWFMARKLRRGIPVAKIIGQKWFYGLCFYTNKHTLDPRPDTETLVSSVISDCDSNIKSPKILDLGTGTGCIVISLIKNISMAHGTAIDISRHALSVARKNTLKHNLSNRIHLKHASFNNKKLFQNNKFNIIVSNPPYIAQNDKRVNSGAKHDPALALYAAENGLAAYKTIAQNAKNWLLPGGKIYLEIGIDMGTQVRKIFQDKGWKYVRSETDLGGIERVLIFTI